tara:strand:- start:165 stop:1490 length:1326 start_codon:yes stop_codon:yes gene_type:complete
MKTSIFSTIFLTILCTGFLFAQEQDMEYRRSSLSMILLESESFPNLENVLSSWNGYPFPDKYNQHDIETKSVNVNNIELNDEDLKAAGFLKDTLTSFQIVKASLVGKPVRYFEGDSSLAYALPNEKQEIQIKIDKVIAENKIAHQIVAEWFNLSDAGTMDGSLIQERGFYDATELEAGIAAGQKRASASLGDAGEELIKKSFVTFTNLNFYENEPFARAIRDAAILAVAKANDLVKLAAEKAAEKLYEATKDGYSLRSKTWLYQLDWNDSIQAVFYQDMWNNPEAFQNSDMFKLNFVGVQYNLSMVGFTKDKSLDQIIDKALVRNVNKAFVELQKDNDVFKPKMPIISVDPVVVLVGEKEGVTAKSQFEVLEMVWDKKEGKTTWKSIGTCKVDKKYPIWDNRYNAGEATEEQLDSDGNVVYGTRFKGSKSIQPGMLVKQKK